MKRVFAGFAVALVILTFIVSVYAYGQNKRFSLEKYIENLSQLHPAFYLGNLMVVWSLDTFPMPVFTGDDGVNFKTLDPYTGDTEVLKFFDDLRCFFWRCIGTGAWIARGGLDLLQNFELVIPWNATVDWEGPPFGPKEPDDTWEEV